MSTLTEIDALKVVDDALAQLEDQAARNRVLQWAWAKYSTQSAPTSEGQRPAGSRTERGARRSRKTKKVAKLSPSIVKDLNLRPEGMQRFADFASEKKPTTNQEKCVVAVYYLSHMLNVSGISIDHVFTCFKDVNWRVPSDLYTTLLTTAHRTGWLDTSDTNNIRATPRGENVIEYDLPKKPADGDS
jgi:hypothetical protein